MTGCDDARGLEPLYERGGGKGQSGFVRIVFIGISAPRCNPDHHLGLTRLGDDLLEAVALLGYDLIPSSVAKPYTRVDRFRSSKQCDRGSPHVS